MLLTFKDKKQQRNFWIIFFILIGIFLIESNYTDETPISLGFFIVWLIFYRLIFWLSFRIKWIFILLFDKLSK